MSIKGARPNNRRISAHLIVRNLPVAIDFYERALGAEVLYCSQMPGGAKLHAQLKIYDSTILLSEENMGMPEEVMAQFEQGIPTRAPVTLNGTSVILELYVDDVDAAFRKALDAGGSTKIPVAEAFYGDKYGQLADPFGHVWALATVVEELTGEEVDKRAEEHFGRMTAHS